MQGTHVRTMTLRAQIELLVVQESLVRADVLR